jgi:hypothetical protein
MQYLLTEEEMADVRRMREFTSRLNPEALRNVVEHVATTMIPTVPINGSLGSPRDRPHGCIHVEPPDGQFRPRYCDGCQVQGICQQPKHWSK